MGKACRLVRLVAGAHPEQLPWLAGTRPTVSSVPTVRRFVAPSASRGWEGDLRGNIFG